MGCDGFWDCVDPQKVCEYISQELKNHKNNPEFNISHIIGDLFDKIIAKTPDSIIFFLILANIGTDNISCILIEFLSKKMKNEKDE